MGCSCTRSANEALINEFWNTLEFRTKNNSTDFLNKAKKAISDRNPDSELRREFKSHLVDEIKCIEIWGLLKSWHRNELFIYLFFLLKKDDRTDENFLELVKETGIDLVAGDKIRKDVFANLFYNYASCISKECFDYLKPQADDIDLREVYSNDNLTILTEKRMLKGEITLNDFYENIMPYLNNDNRIREELFEVYYEKKRENHIRRTQSRTK
jgi:hypothetical protein